MDIKINEMEKKYKQEIQIIFNELVKEVYPDIKVKKTHKFGSEISELFQITAYKDYDDYIKIINQIEEYDPKLVEQLEDYLDKEINLISLLSLHAGIDKLKLSKKD